MFIASQNRLGWQRPVSSPSPTQHCQVTAESRPSATFPGDNSSRAFLILPPPPAVCAGSRATLGSGQTSQMKAQSKPNSGRFSSLARSPQYPNISSTQFYGNVLAYYICNIHLLHLEHKGRENSSSEGSSEGHVLGHPAWRHLTLFCLQRGFGLRGRPAYREKRLGLPGGKARLAALAAAGVKSWAIVEETAQSQLLPDGLPLILLGLEGKGDKKAMKLPAMPERRKESCPTSPTTPPTTSSNPQGVSHARVAHIAHPNREAHLHLSVSTY